MNEWLKGLVDKAKGFVWDDEPDAIVQDQRTAVEADSFDELSYRMLTDTVPNLRKSIREVAEDHDYVEPAYEDLFNLLHQGDPMFKDVRRMKEGYDANHEMLSSMARTDEFKQLRDQTAHDEWGTAFAMLAMQDEMRERFEQVRQAREAREQAKQDAQAAQQNLQYVIDQAGQPGVDEAGAAAALQQATAQAQAADEALQAAQDAQQQAAEQAGEQMAQAADNARQEIEDDAARCAAYGVGMGELKRMPWNERRALTRQLDQDKLAQLAKLVGAFRQYGDAERRRKVKHAPSVIVDVKLGKDIEHLVADEFTRLGVPELEDLFWLNYAQQSLMEWEEQGPQNLGQGPIIVVCDESGSMGAVVDKNGNTREMWSKAISMALCDQAKRGKRDFIYIGFSGGRELYEKRFNGGNAPLDEVIEFVQHFYGGGTNYVPPLTRAKDLIAEYGKAGKPKPDIVFVTDDDCSVPDAFVKDWQAVKSDLDMTCYGIQIGVTQTSRAMHRLCDKTILLTRLNSNPQGMQELFRTI